MVARASPLGKPRRVVYPVPMPAKKKTTKKSPAKKVAAKKAVVKKKAAAKKPAKKKSPAKNSKPAGPREQAIANSALKLVDQAAALLRQGIRTSADTSAKTRLQAKQQAHTLLTRASSTLGDLLSDSTSVLHRVIGRI